MICGARGASLTTPAIVVRDLNFTYLKSKQPALEQINFEIDPGSIVILAGPVGAGKSTLLRTLNALIPKLIPGRLSGDIIVAGHRTIGKDPAFMARFISLVFDDPTLQIVSMTAEQDVAFGPANLGLPRAEIWSRVKEAIDTVGLSGFEKRDPRTLSGGEQQLLALAGVLAMRPQIVALDEPVAMLDPLGKKRVLRALQKLNSEHGTTIIIAESGTEIEAVCEFADSLILMDRGQVLTTGTPGEVFAKRELVKQSRLRIPQVTQVAYRLNLSERRDWVPVTLDGCKHLLSNILAEGTTKDHRSKATDDEQVMDSNTMRGPVEKAIIARNIRHVFPTDPPVRALRGIDLEIERGEFVALLGQNGSGKSTLAFHLVGVEKPTNPDSCIYVDNVDVVQSRLSDVVTHVNYLFQNPANQLFCETFGQEVTFGPRALGLDQDECVQRGRESLELVGLGSCWDDFALNADRSTEALLSLAAVLSMAPQTLIADEPTGGLDHEAGKRVMEVLKAYNQQGHTIIVITHDMQLAAEYASRLIVLHRGRIWMDGPPREVLRQKDKLATTQLAPPQITLLAQALMNRGMPSDVLTVEEFIAVLKQIRSN
jgi:energy-coupling factor transporter ATP-binding protein EcfA2